MRTDNRRRIFTLLDHDASFERVANPAILNKIDFTDRDYASKLNASMYARSGELNFVARCNCGHMTGNRYLGMTCPWCHHPVRTDMEAATGHLSHTTWLAMPEFIPAVLHPKAYQVLSKWLSYKKGANYIDAIIDPNVELPKELEGVVTGRGHRYFYENFDTLMDYFLNHHRATARKPSAPLNRLFIERYRRIIFCRHLPVLASVLHPILTADASPNSRRYVDSASRYALEAAIELSYVEFSPRRNPHQATIEGIIHRAYKNYILYLEEIARKRLSKKRSLPRQHLFGTRMHWTFRAVIVPIVDPVHSYDELHLPWGVMVNLMRLDIIGQLWRRYGLPLHEAADRQQRAVLAYDADVHEIINRLIAEGPVCRSGTVGIPIIFNRNPSLKRGSLQLLFATKVKTDVHDQTVSMSVLVLKDPNADFDGDALNGVRLLERTAVDDYMILHPAYRYRSTNEPDVGTNISLPDQSLVVLNAFLRRFDPQPPRMAA